MLQRKILFGIKLFVAAAFTSCSNMQETKQFEPNSRLFKSTYPATWQVESDDGIYTFTESQDLSWAFQVSAYRAIHDTIPNFNISEELQRIVEVHPTATIVALPNRKAVYYTERKGSSLLRIWIIGDKRCKVFYSYTADAPAPQNANFEAAQQVINSMRIQ